MDVLNIHQRRLAGGQVLAGLLLVLLFAGCRAAKKQHVVVEPERSGLAEMEMLGPPPGREARPEDLERDRPIDIQAVPRRQPKPEYPLEAVEADQSCSARILLHVEVDGSVTLVRLEWVEPPDPPFTEHFEASIHTALERWNYSPAHRIHTRELPDGSRTSEAVPIKYADRVMIRFRVVDGEGVVE